MTDADCRLGAPLTSRFLTSADRLQRCPVDDIPEVCFVGRSNAGKSSTLNRLTGSRTLARVSKTPGRTQLINFFAVADGGRRAIDDYLNQRTNLVGIVLVMDARRPLQPFDAHMIDWATTRALPMLALLNKADKLKQGARVQALRNVQPELGENCQAALFSAQTGLGVAGATDLVRNWLSSAQP